MIFLISASQIARITGMSHLVPGRFLKGDMSCGLLEERPRRK
jgi:hypothetical protein